MKIIHLNQSDINGGASRAAYRIHQSLLKEGVNSEMWVNKIFSNDHTVKGPLTKIEKLLVNLNPHLINNTLLKMLKTKNKILHSLSVLPSMWVKRINESDADIIHLHWIQNEMLSIKDIGKIKKPIVWTLHDMWAFCGAEHYTEDNRWLEGYSYYNRPSYECGFDLNQWTFKRKLKNWKNPIYIVTPSKWLSNCVGESKLMFNYPKSVIPHPLNTDVFKPIDKKIARIKLNLPKDVPLILFGAIDGGKDPRKGFDLLINALKYLSSDKKTITFELVVFGQEKPKLPLNLGFPIHYLGHHDNDLSLRLSYNSADLMITPSRLEAFGQTASEAQACGVPVVAFNIGGLSDIIEHKKTGYLSKAFDTKDLANGISWVLDNLEIKKLRAYSREAAKIKLSEKNNANSYIKIYKKLIHHYK